MKKLISLFLALAMILMVGAAFATEGGTGEGGETPAVSPVTIEITHDESYEDGNGTPRVYVAYKVFDAQYADNISGVNTQDNKDNFTYTPDKAAISYTMEKNSPWLSAMQASGQTWFDLALAADGSKYIVTPKENAYTTSAHAQAFATYLMANMPANASGTEVTVDAAAVTVAKGYYLIAAKDNKDSVTRLALVTSKAKLVEKNTYITSGKTTSQTSYSVGDTVTYTATVDIPTDAALTVAEGEGYKAGHGPVILHDKMDTALTFDGDDTVAATVDGAAFTGFTVATTVSDTCTFEITIPVTSALLGKTITFTYTATVNDTAATNEGFVNELFSENNGYKTTTDKVYVYTFDFPFKKEFNGSTDTALTATFELRTVANDASTAIAFLDKASGKQEKALTGGSATITIANGETIDLVGLKAGTYYLVETGTSAGYNLLDGPVTVTITDTTGEDKNDPSHTITAEGLDKDGVIVVENNSGTVLPSTGGIGTTIFYVVGGLLLVGAAIVLVARRKANN